MNGRRFVLMQQEVENTKTELGGLDLCTLGGRGTSITQQRKGSSPSTSTELLSEQSTELRKSIEEDVRKSMAENIKQLHAQQRYEDNLMFEQLLMARDASQGRAPSRQQESSSFVALLNSANLVPPSPSGICQFPSFPSQGHSSFPSINGSSRFRNVGIGSSTHAIGGFSGFCGVAGGFGGATRGFDVLTLMLDSRIVGVVDEADRLTSSRGEVGGRDGVASNA